MNKLFFGILAVLIAASIYTHLSQPSRQSAYPLLTWKSDSNPQRYEQIQLFQKWLNQNHPELPRSGNNPSFGVRLNSSNNQGTLIQSVSGMGGDLLDGINPQSYGAMGLLKDVGEYAKSYHFGPNDTYPGVMDSLSYDSKQYAYPSNCAVSNMWINLNTLKEYGIPPPREDWTPEEFARIGKEFVEKANKGESHRTKFLTVSAQSLGFGYALIVARSQGVDAYNETQTACTVNDPRFVGIFQKLYDWTYKDKFLPTAAEVASNEVESGGYGGAAFSNFIYGNYAIIVTGRYALIRFREINDAENAFQMASVMLPQYHYKNLLISARSTGIFAGTRNYEKSRYFLEFLAGKDYNEYIIAHADGLPPNPKYCIGNPAYLAPKEYPNEGNVHANELKWATTIALSMSSTPYYPPNGRDWFNYALGMLLADRETAEGALNYAQLRMNTAILANVRENPRLKQRYDEGIRLQKKIDALKADWNYDRNHMPISGSKIPRNWVRNAYYAKLYAEQNMLAPPQELAISTPTQNFPGSKLRSIRFPSLQFDGVPLGKVMSIISRRSRDTDPVHRGVFLLFRDTSGTDARGKIPVYLNLKQVTLEEVLHHLCRRYGLLWEQKGDWIEITAVAGAKITVDLSNQQ
ncbi:MAG: ABC transporter substrate-binding protein [Victivallaceae bacterium]|nr:ABC transporter substrate-binding protein [Victivallaceae bacterium]